MAKKSIFGRRQNSFTFLLTFAYENSHFWPRLGSPPSRGPFPFLFQMVVPYPQWIGPLTLSLHVFLESRRLSDRWSREPWQRTSLEFSRVSAVSEAIGQVVAGAVAAHFPQVFTCFWSLGGYRACGRGNSGSALFMSFDILLGSRRLSCPWSREPWQRTFLEFSHASWLRTFLEFSRASGVAEAVGQVAAGALAAHFSRVFAWFCGRGSYSRCRRGNTGSALSSSFHVILWPPRLSEKWPRKAHWSLRGFLGSKMLILKAK